MERCLCTAVLIEILMGLRKARAAVVATRGIAEDDFCILWGGAHDAAGYAINTMVIAGTRRVARIVNQTPHGMDTDHLCRNRGCIRFDHLETVTHSENVRCGANGRPCLPADSPCIKCGALDFRIDRKGNGSSQRRCRQCERNKRQLH